MSATKARAMWHAPSGNWYPLADADADVYATMTQKDVTCGVKLDPCSCAIAQAFRRAVKSPDVLIGVSIAYVVMKKNGENVAFRFGVPAATRRAIESFDNGGVVPDEPLKLTVVRPSNGLESQRAEARRTRERWATMPPKKAGKRKKGVRSATSMARTLVVSKAAKANKS